MKLTNDERVRFGLLHPAAAVDDSGETSELECAAGHGALAAGKTEEGDASRFLVRVTSVRKRLLDEDNIAEKYAVDCCRYAGLLPSDAPDRLKIETRQRKAQKGEEEHTMIEIYRDGMEGANEGGLCSHSAGLSDSPGPKTNL